MKLVTTDKKKTVIAEFHPTLRFAREKAKLNVQPAGVVMLDYIVLTWVFAEKKRRERKANEMAEYDWP